MIHLPNNNVVYEVHYANRFGVEQECQFFVVSKSSRMYIFTNILDFMKLKLTSYCRAHSNALRLRVDSQILYARSLKSYFLHILRD